MPTGVKKRSFTMLAAPIHTFRSRTGIMAVACEANPGRKFLLQYLYWAVHMVAPSRVIPRYGLPRVG